MTQQLYSIGELAARSGVPVKTIRYYSDVGLLPPSEVRQSKYRYYSERDRARLETIRMLRELDFSLEAIRGLIDRHAEPGEVLRIQLDALELQIRLLQRRRSVLRAALEHGTTATLSYLDRLHALGRLSAAERSEFVTSRLSTALSGIPVDAEWQQRTFGVLRDVSDEMDEQQLTAWLELAELVTDPGFQARVADQSRPFWTAVADQFDAREWQAATGAVYAAAMQAVRAGRSPESPGDEQVVLRYLGAVSQATGRPADVELAEWIIRHTRETSDSRLERFWALVAIIRRQPDPPPFAEAHRWLMRGLERWLETAQRSG